jgi:mannose-6-phosphate isomerase-like protein (cupin superfamily)
MNGSRSAAAPPDPADELRARFSDDGFVWPVDVLSPSQCAVVSRYLDEKHRPRPLDWVKGFGAADPLLRELALQPGLVNAVKALIGPDIILWGVSSVDREPGEPHPWHTDIESSAPEPGTVTAWLGIEHTSADSSLNVIRGSHLIGAPLQKVAGEQGIPRDQRTAESSLALAQALLPGAALVRPELKDGQALLFDGRLWHGSLNTRPTGRRRALLFQYAIAGRAIRIPDWQHLDWPFVFQAEPLPPVLRVAGRVNRSVNRILPHPHRSPEQLPPLYSCVRAFPWPLPGDPARGWRQHFMFRGSTPVQHQLGCHISVLDAGHSPHPPHAHLDEELLVVLDGEAEILIANAPDDPAPRVERLRPGDFAYYPSFQHHTIRCPGPGAVTYLMFRWCGTPLAEAPALQTRIQRALPAMPELPAGKLKSELLFEGSTGLLHKLHAHWSHVSRGGGYDPHDDEYDVALVLLSGEVRTIGRTVSAPAVIFYPADALHGLRGAGTDTAEYLVFEWHGQRALAGQPAEPPVSRLRQHYREARYRVKSAFDRVRNRLARA